MLNIKMVMTIALFNFDIKKTKNHVVCISELFIFRLYCKRIIPRSPTACTLYFWDFIVGKSGYSFDAEFKNPLVLTPIFIVNMTL